ncbi:hypothetical protein [Paenibacillus sp. USHLN196]|uniref:hypothetical protein n=1 Tax=Paenibacillus sp. USHLN196 TaxID=3081291 RepID=UPI00301952FA
MIWNVKKLTLDERLKQAEENGYTPVKIYDKDDYFFILRDASLKIGSIIRDSLENQYKIMFFYNGRICAKDYE